MYLDVDGTITDSISAYCKAYNYYYRQYPKFKEANPSLVQTWNMEDQCSLAVEIYGNSGVERLFASDKFFSELQFIDEYTYDVLEELNEKYKIIICSVGTPLNISKKALWIEKNLPFIKNFMYLGLETKKYNYIPEKSIFIDDYDKYLIPSISKRPICFVQREFEWNRNWNGEKVYNWLEILDLLK